MTSKGPSGTMVIANRDCPAFAELVDDGADGYVLAPVRAQRLHHPLLAERDHHVDGRQRCQQEGDRQQDDAPQGPQHGSPYPSLSPFLFGMGRGSG